MWEEGREDRERGKERREGREGEREERKGGREGREEGREGGKGGREGREGEREGRKVGREGREGGREGREGEREEEKGEKNGRGGEIRKGRRGRRGGREGGRIIDTYSSETDWESYISMSDSILPVSSVDVIGRILQLTHPICARRNKQSSHLSKLPSGRQVHHTLFVVSPVSTVGVPCVVCKLSLPIPLIVHPISLSNQSDYSIVII